MIPALNGERWGPWKKKWQGKRPNVKLTGLDASIKQSAGTSPHATIHRHQPWTHPVARQPKGRERFLGGKKSFEGVLEAEVRVGGRKKGRSTQHKELSVR